MVITPNLVCVELTLEGGGLSAVHSVSTNSYS
jgi:hypothetical protein